MYLLGGGHQEGGHLDLPACPVQQLRSRHEVLCLASRTRSAQQLMLMNMRPHSTAVKTMTAYSARVRLSEHSPPKIPTSTAVCQLQAAGLPERVRGTTARG